MSKQIDLPYTQCRRPILPDWLDVKDAITKAIYPLKPTYVLMTYWYLAAERQKIFFRRLAGESPPWSDDPIFQEYKFTNAYRASDRVSQYLIKNVLYDQEWSDEDLFFRCLLFKIFNKIETWELLRSEVGEPCVRNFDARRFIGILGKAQLMGNRIYSSAYIMPSGGKGIPKHQFHLKLLQQMLKDKLWFRIKNAQSLKEVYELLLACPSFGPFLAFQYTIDLNYSSLIDFDEVEFVVAGPGAHSGIRKSFDSLGGFSAEDVIYMMVEKQDFFFDVLSLDFKSLFGRPLKAIDCQNLFCETDKYSRVAHPELKGIGNRSRIKQRYLNPSVIGKVHYPRKWEIPLR